MQHNHRHSEHDHDHHHVNGDCNERNFPEPSPIQSSVNDPEKIMRKNVLFRLKTASILCFSFLLVEVTGGLLAGSLAVLSDAAHLLADLAAFAVAIAASYLADLPATTTHTFGLKRSEALAALFSMVCLALVSVWLAVEAVRRLWPFIVSGHVPDVDVDGKLMSIIAFIGVIVNVALAFVLGEHHVHMPGSGNCDSHSHEHSHEHSHQHGHSHEQESLREVDQTSYESLCVELQHNDELAPPPTHTPRGAEEAQAKRNINLHAAYLHVLADLAQSVAVLIAGLIIWAKPSWDIVDPICTILFCIMVFYSTLGVIRSSVSVLLEAVPPGLSWDKVHDDIVSIKGISDVHDLHIWCISHGEPALSVHACAPDTVRAMKDINAVCLKYGIHHATIQIQPFGADVPSCITCRRAMRASCYNFA